MGTNWTWAQTLQSYVLGTGYVTSSFFIILWYIFQFLIAIILQLLLYLNIFFEDENNRIFTGNLNESSTAYANKTLNNAHKKRCGPILWVGFHCLKAEDPLGDGNLLLTFKFLAVQTLKKFLH